MRRNAAPSLPARLATPEGVFLSRRSLLSEALRLGAALAASTLPGRVRASDAEARYPAPRNRAHSVDLEPTPESEAARYNNFYEFGPGKDVAQRAAALETRPWTLEVSGLVERTQTLDADGLAKLFPFEERVYRFRCVEAWAMVVPWTGFPLARLLARAGPQSGARFVRFESFLRPEQAPGQRLAFWHPWPYSEALTLEEATNELCLLVTGVYGKPLPPQHGAPLRLIVPWKYGFKSIKSIVRIELTAERPESFWNRIQPDEYDFWANVNPFVPHPRWSQATERLLASNIRQPTLLYNGYARQVAGLYR